MTDLEKVVKGLECCDDTSRESLKCEECPYREADTCSAIAKLHADALVLLKAQEPRVMTLEDVKQVEVGTVVWLEWRIESKINSAIFYRLINKGIDDSLGFHVLDGFEAARLACYGAKWRCWTARPTDEQREAVKWDATD